MADAIFVCLTLNANDGHAEVRVRAGAYAGTLSEAAHEALATILALAEKVGPKKPE